ncbi:MAG: TrkH family potassium uptake protein [Deltaproteobacteria bacterium]|nr:TrkH family potassium uptake protein [Deltaproteobacteria bacterium]
MHPKTVAYLLSLIVGILAASLAVPLAAAIAFGEIRSAWAFGAALLCSALTGLVLRRQSGAAPATVYRREAVAVVGLSWFLISLLGGLPYFLDGSLPTLFDSTFEAASGFTTTGASVYREVETLSRSILLWRSLTHWLGGMGIIVLFVAIFSQLGVGGRRLFEVEVPGPITEGLRPKIRETSSALWRIYVTLTLLLIGALMLCGLDWFDAVNHAFATLATGGFSTRNLSVAGLKNPAAEWVIALFMLIAGVNFALYYAALHGRLRTLWRDVELRVYLAIVGVAALLIAIDIWGRYDSVHDTLRAAVFQTVAITTTTGFASDNFDAYPVTSKVILVTLMFIGGCAGSTAGGLKVSRIVVALKAAWIEVVQGFHPQGVIRLRLGSAVIGDDIVRSILAYLALYFAIFVAGSVVMAALGLDLVTAVTSVVATLGSIGPGLGKIGAIENYAFVPAAGKAVLICCMILGRLELTAVLALLSRALWRR